MQPLQPAVTAYFNEMTVQRLSSYSDTPTVAGSSSACAVTLQYVSVRRRRTAEAANCAADISRRLGDAHYGRPKCFDCHSKQLQSISEQKEMKGKRSKKNTTRVELLCFNTCMLKRILYRSTQRKDGIRYCSLCDDKVCLVPPAESTQDCRRRPVVRGPRRHDLA